jgi:F-type H+-transporting ATPase subunit b
MKKFLPATLMCLFLSIGGTPLLHAEEGEAGAHGEKAHEEEGPLGTVFKWANLLVLIGGVVYLLRKPAREFFETRKKDITIGLERAKTAQEESSRRMADIEKRLARMSQDIAAMKTEAEADSSKERESILAEAKRDMERLVEQSRQEVDRIARGIERDIKGKIADAVVERAGRTLETQMTEDDQKRVVVRFLNKV